MTFGKPSNGRSIEVKSEIVVSSVISDGAEEQLRPLNASQISAWITETCRR